MRSMHPAEDTNRRLKSDATTRYSEVFYKKKVIFGVLRRLWSWSTTF